MILQSPHDFCILILGQKSYDGRRETARVQSALIGTPYRDIARAPNDRHLKCAETIRLPYDLVAILSENFDENHNKKSKAYDACVYCYHRRRSKKKPTMYTLDTRTAVGACNLGISHCINTMSWYSDRIVYYHLHVTSIVPFICLIDGRRYQNDLGHDTYWHYTTLLVLTNLYYA